MSQPVSPDLGHGPLATPSVHPATAPFTTGSRVLFSQFRGPFVFNETEEERKKREEDEEKKSNFDKVRQKAEREEAARKKVEEERDQLLAEKKKREEDAKKAEDAKLAEQQQFEKLAQQREAEAAAKSEEAAREKKRADDAEARLKTIEDQQEAELAELLKSIPEEKRPPLDTTDHVSKRMQQVKHVKSLLETGPKPQVGGGARPGNQSAGDRVKELRNAAKDRPLTEEEKLELMELSGQ